MQDQSMRLKKVGKSKSINLLSRCIKTTTKGLTQLLRLEGSLKFKETPQRSSFLTRSIKYLTLKLSSVIPKSIREQPYSQSLPKVIQLKDIRLTYKEKDL